MAPGKGRSQAAKVGRLRYIVKKVGRLERLIKRMDARQRTIFHGLRDFMNFDQDFIQTAICRDEADQAILQRLLEVGEEGRRPTLLAQDLSKLKLSRFDVTRRIQRMNKRLQKELGQNVAEKRGHRWALTGFARRIWGVAREEALEEAEVEDNTALKEIDSSRKVAR